MRAIMVAGISIIVLLVLTMALYHAGVEPPPIDTPEIVEIITPAPAMPIEVIDGEVWVAIPVEGMAGKEHEG